MFIFSSILLLIHDLSNLYRASVREFTAGLGTNGLSFGSFDSAIGVWAHGIISFCVVKGQSLGYCDSGRYMARS